MVPSPLSKENHMLYEIINPSDACCFEAPSLEVATLFVLLVSEGKYGACPEKEEDGHKEVPLLFLGGLDEWWEREVGTAEFSEVLKDKRAEVIASLESTFYGTFKDYYSYKKALELIDSEDNRKKYIEHWSDLRRTSVNNIVGYAHSLAERMRKNDEEEGEANA